MFAGATIAVPDGRPAMMASLGMDARDGGVGHLGCGFRVRGRYHDGFAFCVPYLCSFVALYLFMDLWFILLFSIRGLILGFFCLL